MYNLCLFISRQQRESLSEAEIEEAINNDNISDLRSGPCGSSLVNAYSCFLRHTGGDEVGKLFFHILVFILRRPPTTSLIIFLFVCMSLLLRK